MTAFSTRDAIEWITFLLAIGFVVGFALGTIAWRVFS